MIIPDDEIKTGEGKKMIIHWLVYESQAGSSLSSHSRLNPPLNTFNFFDSFKRWPPGSCYFYLIKDKGISFGRWLYMVLIFKHLPLIKIKQKKRNYKAMLSPSPTYYNTIYYKHRKHIHKHVSIRIRIFSNLLYRLLIIQVINVGKFLLGTLVKWGDNPQLIWTIKLIIALSQLKWWGLYALQQTLFSHFTVCSIANVMYLGSSPFLCSFLFSFFFF
jgi:hypothetical protein